MGDMGELIKRKYSETPRTIEEVKEHNKKNNNWVIIRNSVYDVNKFLENEFHPGGFFSFTIKEK
jgi:cytochrome b involved in lipid metabolism